MHVDLEYFIGSTSTAKNISNLTTLIYVKSCEEQGLLMPKWPFTTRISYKMRKTDVN